MRIVQKLIVLMMLSALLMCAAQAEETAASQFTVNLSGVITSYSGQAEDLVIPSVVNGVKVTGIGTGVFWNEDAIKSVVIPEGVTSIGSYAFYDCGSMESITLPEGIKSIGENAFLYCSALKKICVSSIESWWVIREEAGGFWGEWFEGRSASLYVDGQLLTQAVISDKIKAIPDNAFSGCRSLTSVSIPSGVTSIGASAFRNCTALTSITIPSGVTSIGESAFYGCSALTGISIPAGVKSIGPWTFLDCIGLTDITIPEGVTDIGNRAFYSCSSLAEVVLPKSLKKIGEHAFDWCYNLEALVIPDGVTEVGEEAFFCVPVCNAGTSGAAALSAAGCSFTDPDCPDIYILQLTDASGRTVLQATGSAYDESGEVTVPQKIGGYEVTSIGEGAYFRAMRINLPDTIESIGEYAFDAWDVLIFDSSTVIEQYALENMIAYISSSKNASYEGINTARGMVKWVVGTFIDSDMSEYERALRLYDWLGDWADYDEELLWGGEPSGEYDAHKAEGALLSRWAVCDGFSRAYEMLLKEAGLEVVCPVGPDHMWNIAKIDGKWYQFDITWDGGSGGTAHDYFALCDDAMRSVSHYHEGQYTQLDKVCDSWEANYYYRTGKLDPALEKLERLLNINIAAGAYSGQIELCDEEFVDYYNNPYSGYMMGAYSGYTVALIMNARDEWELEGQMEIIPNDNSNYDYVFTPARQPVRLPAAVKTIDDEAFAGTSAVQIILPEGVEYIGARAFADSAALKYLNLPDAVSYIAPDAFSGCKSLKVYCTENSYAHGWCVANKVEYVLK